MSESIKRLIAAVLLAIAITAPARAGFQEGADAAKRGDYARAIKEWRPIADKGDVNAQFEIARLYHFGLGVPRDDAQAASWLRKAADGGLPKAQLMLGQAYIIGSGLIVDYTEAARWLRKADDQGVLEATIALADLYRSKLGDRAQALRLYQKAAGLGSALAVYNLGMMNLLGEGVPKNEKEGIRLIQQAATMGSTLAQAELGRFYAAGKVVPKDLGEALRWLRKSADQGDARGQTGLGMLYSQGWGVAKDLAEAARWFQLAAAQGYAPAQTRLCLMYDGKELPENPPESAKWCRLAAEQGDEIAQSMMGVFYQQGYGISQDYVQAYMWLTLAIKGTHANDAVQRLTLVKQTLAKRMTPAQIAEGERLASEWKPKNVREELGFDRDGLIAPKG